jgi:hypothetical protein
MLAKLTHGLANTNKQDPLYYSAYNLCPICHAIVELLNMFSSVKISVWLNLV